MTHPRNEEPFLIGDYMSAPRQPVLNQVVGGLAVVGAVGASVSASGLVDVVGNLNPRWGALLTSICAIAAWLSRAPVGKR